VLFDDVLHSVNHRSNQPDDRVFVGVVVQLSFEGCPVGVSQIGVQVDLADPDLRG
jgi:hypothetical protein